MLFADAVKKADDADLMRKAASEATDKTLSELSNRRDVAHQKLSRAIVREATAEAQREGALAEAIHLKGRLQDAIVGNKRLVETHAEAMTAERARSDARETRDARRRANERHHQALGSTSQRVAY